MKKTFAEFVNDKREKAATIRTLVIPQDDALKNQFLKDAICADVNITKINNKTNNVITIKCTTESDAINLEQQITSKYRGHIKVNKVELKNPMIEITNLPSDLADDEILALLIKQNHWLISKTIKINRSYIIKLNNWEYKKLIIECDVVTQKQFIERQVVIVGFQERRCFEMFNTIQCLKCYRYGHIQTDCKFDMKCKKVRNNT